MHFSEYLLSASQPNIRPRVEERVISQAPPSLEEEYDDEDDDEDYDLDDIYVRTKFLESWLWTDVTLPAAPEADG